MNHGLFVKVHSNGLRRLDGSLDRFFRLYFQQSVQKVNLKEQSGASFQETSLRSANLEKVMVDEDINFTDTDFTEAIIWVGNIQDRGRAVRVILPNGDIYTASGMEIGY
jgi:hypothetical protein